MPKQEYQILGFHGGINDNSDPKDIRDEEVREADGVSVHRLGRLVNIGNKDNPVNNTIANLTNATADIEPGYGLYYFSTDYDNSENANNEDWLAIYNKANDNIRFYYQDKPNNNNSPAFAASGREVSMGGDIKPNFYYVDGLLRIGDASFSRPSKWHGLINSELYWTSINATGESITNLHNIKEWKNGVQELQSFDKLNIELLLYDATSEGPDYADLEEGVNFNKLLLSYWKNEGEGEWNGRYQFGATPMYLGNQEGPISEFNTHLNFYDDEVIFQVHIPTVGNSATVSDNATHLLYDNRIIGINFYFREVGDDDWTFLMETDLKKGGQHLWKVYNGGESDGTTNSQKGYGYWTGSTQVAITVSSHLAFFDNSDGTNNGSDGDWYQAGTGAATTGKSYYNVYLKVLLKNDNSANGFSGRKGFLRIWGGAASPIYVNDIPLATTGLNDEYLVPMRLPGLGTDREFRVQVLDENFTVVADSGIETMTIVDSGKQDDENYQDQTREI